MKMTIMMTERKVIDMQQPTSVMIMLNIFLSDECKRQLEFKEGCIGERLMNHMIRKVDVMDGEFCGVLCFMEHNCVSYNLMTISENGKHHCELNNATHEEHEEDLEKDSNYEYHGAKVRASQRSDFKLYEVLIFCYTFTDCLSYLLQENNILSFTCI